MALRAVLARTTVLDRIIILALVAGAGFLFVTAARSPRGTEVVAERDGRVIFKAPLSANRAVSLKGPLGKTVLSIGHGRAWIVSSPCPRKICIRMGKISRAGDILACVPNHLLVRITGRAFPSAKPYDLLSR